ncbi:MAG: histidine kinase [Acidobacteriota bacterium]
MPGLVHRLRWKVAASATVAAVAAVLAVMTLSELGLVLTHRHALADEAMRDRVANHTGRLAAQLSALGRLDASIADAWIGAHSEAATPRLSVDPGPSVPLRLALHGTDRQHLAGPRLTMADDALNAIAAMAPAAVRRDDGVLVAAAPIAIASNATAEKTEWLGFVVVEAATRHQSLGTILRRFLLAMPATVLLLLPVGVAVGSLFGLITTRGLVRRLRHLGDIAAAWSRGALNERVGDRSKDELGDLTRDLETMAAELDRLIGSRQALAAVDERNRLARELHDTVKQHVFSISMFLGSLDAQLPSESTPATETLGRTRRLVAQVSRDLDDLILALRPAELQDQGLAKALEELADRWSTRTEIPVDLRIRGERELPLPVEEALFRVAQEALANVTRHASAEAVDIRLDASDSSDDDDRQLTVRLSIRDDGEGFDTDVPTTGFGLASMRDRLAAIGGRVVIDSVREQGTTVDARWSGARPR